jgi:hypothetical protein
MRSSDATVTVVAVTMGEPVARLRRMIGAVARQDHTGPLHLVVAAPRADHARIQQALVGWDRGLVRLVENPGGSRTAGLNRCIDAAVGEYVVRVDARSVLAPDHVRRTVARLAADSTVGAVGGHQVPWTPPPASARAAGIERALRNRWLLGNADYRDPTASGPTDTVYLGSFRGAELRRLRYDEALTANEDFDLCRRMRDAGRRVWLEAGVDVRYEPRTTWSGLRHQYEAFGRSKVVLWRRTGSRPAPRQLCAIVAAGTGALLTVAAARRPTVLAAGVTAAIGAVLVTDELTAGRAPLRVRVAALPAHAAVEGGWVLGIVRGLLDRGASDSGDVEHPLERDAREPGGLGIDDDLVHQLAAGE